MTKEEIFAQKINELVKHAHNLEREDVKKVMDILEKARKEIAAQIASTPWEAYHMEELKQAIGRAIDNFGIQYGILLQDAQKQSWDLGIDMVDMPLREINIFTAIPEIDTTILSILQGFSADLVKGLTEDAKKRITTELVTAFMGQKTPYEAMEAIGRNLDDPSIFHTISRRAETITQTEGNRVREAASQARKEKAAGVVPGLMKQWKHSYYGIKEPRETHLAADGQIRKVDEPFDIGGEELMYPLDPAGSAANTINCHCYTIPYHPRWDEVAGD